MELREVFILGTAVSMDALGVTLSIGVNGRVARSRKVGFIISFAFFQFLLFFLGGAGGFLFEKYVTGIPNVIGGITIIIVGLLMLKEGFDNKEEDDGFLNNNIMCIILGISVSIDALVIGFTAFHNNNIDALMLCNSVLVGLITLFLCTLGFYLCKYIRKIEFVVKYADFLGGIILAIFGLKMLLF